MEKLRIDKGLALVDIVHEVTIYLLRMPDIPALESEDPNVIFPYSILEMRLLDRLARIEFFFLRQHIS